MRKIVYGVVKPSFSQHFVITKVPDMLNGLTAFVAYQCFSCTVEQLLNRKKKVLLPVLLYYLKKSMKIISE